MDNLAMALLSIGQFHEKNGLLVTVRFGSVAEIIAKPGNRLL